MSRATGALFTTGAKLVSRWNSYRTKQSGVFTFVVEKHDSVTRTFSGTFEYSDGPTAVNGSYDGQKVSIVQDNGKCGFDLVATGTIPMLKGTYSGSVIRGCGQGGTVEIGLQ